MNKFVSFLSYMGTLGAGIGIGVLCSRDYFAKRESERADREIESMKESMRKTYIKEEKDEHVIGKSAIIDKKEEDAVDSMASAFMYHTFSKLDAARAEAEHPREEENKKPYFIDIDDFDSVTLGYDKKELSYYMEDGTLVDEKDDILSIVDTVGSANIESFENSLESSCYIRNEALKVDYEISKVFGSYGAMFGDE